VPAAPARPGAGAPGTARSTGDLPPFTRPALAPSLIAAIVLLACVAIVDSSAFVFARWGVTVLGLIVLVFAVRGRAWWAAVLMAAVAVCWNPLAVVPIPGQLWAALQLVAAALFIVVGILVKVPRATESTRASRP
jgi:predicted membrane protein